MSEQRDVVQHAAKSYDNITLAHKEREEQTKPFRHYNNYIKKLLIQGCFDAMPKGSPIKVLDLGSGRGGDLSKWYFGRPGVPIGEYLGVDVSPECVSQAKERLAGVVSKKAQRERFEFEVGDCFSPQFWACMAERYPSAFNAVSIQFALHYGCESKEAVGRLLESIARCMAPGGHFVGTIVDSEVLSQRFHSGSLSNDLFSITFDETEIAAPQLPLGTRYHFQLDRHVDCPEFVIPHDELCLLAGAVGLQPVEEQCHNFERKLFSWKMDGKAARDLNGQVMSKEEEALVTLYRTFMFTKVQ